MLVEQRLDAVTGDWTVEAASMQPREQFSMDLLADERNAEYLAIEGGKITLDFDNGRWVYVVTDIDAETGVVTAEWPD